MFLIFILGRLLFNSVKFLSSLVSIYSPIPALGHALQLPTQLAATILQPFFGFIPPEITQFSFAFNIAHGLLHFFIPYINLFNSAVNIRDSLSMMQSSFPDFYFTFFNSVDKLMGPVIDYTDGELQGDSALGEFFSELGYSASKIMFRGLGPLFISINFFIHAIDLFI